jgi:hypothetical protein
MRKFYLKAWSVSETSYRNTSLSEEQNAAGVVSECRASVILATQKGICSALQTHGY